MEAQGKTENNRLEIVPMEAAHIPQIAAIEREAFSEPWSEQAFSDALSLNYAYFYAACINGQVAGYCGVYLAADEGEITNVATAGAYRRRHIAEQMLKTLINEAKTRGVVRLFLEVRASNAPAIRLYEKIGFQNCGVRRNFYKNPVEDALLMRYK